ncbi:DgyrCDS8166 [Dimorphilus gyrociliatus]|uniref:DgyrCDS8166 n=1 Tax=Dimorphilus gyrociliatus TaxID=2664684 RepID=A0A7I8VVS2_9ANNE|nr:DgyrCDS8166 [Dimorphilus gyrociliatus]
MSNKLSYPDCSPNLDDDGKMKAFDDRINGILTSTFTGLGIVIGSKLKLLEILSTGKFTCEELGQKAKVKEHYLKEWLSLMVSGGIIDSINNEVPEKYTLPEYRKKTLVNGFGTQFMLMTPEYSKLVPKLIACMKINGPDGYEFDPHTARMRANAESEGEGEGEGHGHGHKSKHGHGHKHVHPKIPDWSKVKKTYESVPNLVQRLEKGINALDLGCGNGHLFITLAKQFPNSTFQGADPFAEAIEDANKEVKELGLKNVSFSVADVLALPEEWTGKFDYVHASRMLHHVKKPMTALQQFVKVLKPDGTFSLFEGGVDGFDRDFVGDVSTIFSKFNDLFCFGPTAEFNKEHTVGLGLNKKDAIKILEGVGFKVLVPEYQPSNEDTHCEESGNPIFRRFIHYVCTLN